MHRLLSRFVVMLSLCLCQAWVLAGDTSPLRMDHVTLQGDFIPDEAVRLPFQPYEPGKRIDFKGGGQGTVFRLHLPPSSTDNGNYNVIIQPRYLMRVVGWFKYREASGWERQVAGRMLPPVKNYYSTRDLVFELKKPLADGVAAYLYVQDTGSRKPINVSLVKREAYLSEDVSFSRYIATLYGAIFVLALINLVFYFFIRETPFLLYSIYMMSALVSMLWQEGWIVKIISIKDDFWMELGLWVFAPLSVLLFFQFYRAYLGLSLDTRDGKLLFGFQLFYGALMLIRVADGLFLDEAHFNFWTQMLNATLMLGAVGLFVLTLSYWLKGYRLAGYLFVANSILISATLMRIYYAFQFSSGGFWLAHAFEAALAIDAVLLSLALADRTLSIKRERDKAKRDFQRVDTAYKREQLLARFVRQAHALAARYEGRDFVNALDGLMYRSIGRILDVHEVVLLSRSGKAIDKRSLGEDRIMSRLFLALIDRHQEKLMADCRRRQVVIDDVKDYPVLRERYRYMLLPIKVREHKDYCVLLLVPREQALNNELVYGLREFVEKAVHACMEAENVEKLQRSARYDVLTGIYNRASMEMHVSRFLEECANGGRGLALAFVDLDHFKSLNDSLGHDFGDQCLKLLCQTMITMLPDEVVLGRFGGDEFLVLLPGEDYFQATESLARLNPALQEASPREGVSLSVSVGIAECRSGQRMSVAQLLKLADMSLYAAKAAGRGCIGAKASVAAI